MVDLTDLKMASVLEPTNKAIKEQLAFVQSKRTPKKTTAPQTNPVRRRIPIREIGSAVKAPEEAFLTPRHTTKIGNDASSNENKMAETIAPAMEASSTCKADQSKRIDPTMGPISTKADERKSRTSIDPSSESTCIKTVEPTTVTHPPSMPPNTTNTSPERPSPIPLTTPLRPLSPPRTGFDFKRDWKTLYHPHDAQRRQCSLAYLRSIALDTLPTLLKSSLDATLLLQLVDVLHLPLGDDVSAADRAFVLAFLAAIGKTPRFAMNILFLSRKEKQGTQARSRSLTHHANLYRSFCLYR